MAWLVYRGRETIVEEPVPGDDLQSFAPAPFTEIEIQVMALRLKGRSMERIAEELGCTYQNVQYHLAKPAIREELKRRTEGALEAAQQRYLQALPALADAEIDIALGFVVADAPRVRGLQNALERAGMVPTKKTEVSGGLKVTDESARAELETARAARIAAEARLAALTSDVEE